jgi:hypothetical protein
MMTVSEGPDLRRAQTDHLTWLEVEDFRRSAASNGYKCVRLMPRQKRPLDRSWQLAQSPQLFVHEGAPQNTGICIDDLRVIDVDIDDPVFVRDILHVLRPLLPSRPLVRTRAGSARMALVYRTAQPRPKNVINTQFGKIELLGQGQQLAVHGIHPSGQRWVWKNGWSPAVVAAKDLTLLSEVAEEAIVAALHGLGRVRNSAVADLKLNDELTAGLSSAGWFDSLSPRNQAELITKCLDVVDNRISDDRGRWLRIVFAAADAERRGCSDARRLALEWSRKGAAWTDEMAFDTVWSSYREGKGITIGTLIHLAQAEGFDLARWQADQRQEALPAHGSKLWFSAFDCFDEKAIPKRDWLHGRHLLRKFCSLVIAPGGGGKSAVLVTEALALASGRPLLGQEVRRPLRVGLWNGEDPKEELQRRIIATINAHGLTPDSLGDRLYYGSGRDLDLVLGSVDRGGISLKEDTLDRLVEHVTGLKLDVAIFDPFVSLHRVPENDNTAMDAVAKRLNRLADRANCAVLLAHHTRKTMGGETAAEDARGASALLASVRSARTLNFLDRSEAPLLGISEEERYRYVKIALGKSNPAPLDDAVIWIRLESVKLANGDDVGVAKRWMPPPRLAQLVAAQPADLMKRLGPGPWRVSDRSSGWIGAAIAQALGRSVPQGPAKKEFNLIIRQLLQAGLIRQASMTTSDRKTKEAYERTVPMSAPDAPISGASPPQP